MQTQQAGQGTPLVYSVRNEGGIETGSFIVTKIYTAYILIYSAIIFGYGSLAAFAAFLFFGALSVVNLGMNDATAILFDTGLSLLFFIQHSIMARRSFRRSTTVFMPEEYYRAFYAITSGIVLLIIIVLWQKTAYSLPVIKGFFRWTFRLFFLISVAGFIWGSRSLKHFDPLGIRNVLNRLRGRKPWQTPFIVKGAYRWVRHPLYFFALLMIWSSPDLTADRMLFNVLWTLWIVTGSVFEERDLVDEFGDEYREYQQKVPMLIPVRFPDD